MAVIVIYHAIFCCSATIEVPLGQTSEITSEKHIIICFAPVICNHGHPASGQDGDSCGNEVFFCFCIVPAVKGKYP